MKTILLTGALLLSSLSVQALPLVSPREQVRAELWHEGLKIDQQTTQRSELEKKTSPRLNEELERALGKYQL